MRYDKKQHEVELTLIARAYEIIKQPVFLQAAIRPVIELLIESILKFV